MVNVSVRKTDIRGFESLSELSASLAQLVEQLFRNQQVAGSIPVGGSEIITKFAPAKTIYGYGTDIYLLQMLATLTRLRRLCCIRK